MGTGTGASSPDETTPPEGVGPKLIDSPHDLEVT
jgi:hypothetical protein